VAGGEGGTRATLAALGANVGIAAAKLVAFAITASASMLAEAIHSLADTVNQLLLLVGMRRSLRTPTPEHPFGYGRERYFWSFVVTIVLFTLGSLFALAEGVEKVRHPHEVTSLGWAVSVLVVAIGLETVSLIVAVREANRQREGSWWRYIRRAKTPELPVLLLEDSGALVGLVFALAGITLAASTGDARFDAFGSLAIGGLLGVIAVVLSIEMRSLLVGESASPKEVERIKQAITSDPQLESLIHLRTQHLGPEELLVAAKVMLTPTLSFNEVVDAINRIEERVREAVPTAHVMYIEPDVVVPGRGRPPWVVERS
jgi:cation diffusion facilitator family transporter